jgi:Zn-dependent peptidase ImmA (M78 family)
MNGLLDQLRAVAPNRRLSLTEAYILAERQATKFLRLTDVTAAPIPTPVIAGLPFMQVAVRLSLGSSGATQWIKPRWVVLLNAAEPKVRQRFSLAHEFKHIIDHPHMTTMYGSAMDTTSRRRLERLCDYFAACLLMPRPWVKAAFTSGIQDITDLAEVFSVSSQAMQVRLQQLGLVERYQRCSEMDNSYFRSLPVLPANLAA